MSQIRRSEIIKKDVFGTDTSNYPTKIKTAIQRKYPARYYQIFQNPGDGWKRCYNEEDNNLGIRIFRKGTTPIYQLYIKENQRNHNAVIGYYCIETGCVRPQFDIVLNGIEQPIGYYSVELCLSFCPQHTTDQMRTHHSNNFEELLRGRYVKAIIRNKRTLYNNNY